MGLSKVPASLGSPQMPLKPCVAWLHQGQVPWESLVPSPGHIKPVQLLVLLAGVSGSHGVMLATAMECIGLKVNWAASALTLTEQRGEISVWGKMLSLHALVQKQQNWLVCKTARDTLASPHLAEIVLKREKDGGYERVCMCRRPSTVCLPLPLPPFLSRGFTGIKN